MVFSSIPFVFFFLPLCLILYYGTSFLPCPGRRLDVQTPSERGKFPGADPGVRLLMEEAVFTVKERLP